MDKPLPSFVSKDMLKGNKKLFEEDNTFIQKNIHIRGGWLDIKTTNLSHLM